MHLDPTRTRAQRIAAKAFMAMSLVLAQACAPEATQPEQDPSWTPKDPVSGQFFSESNPSGTGQTVPAPMAHPRTDVDTKVDVDQPIAPVRTPRPRV